MSSTHKCHRTPGCLWVSHGKIKCNAGLFKAIDVAWLSKKDCNSSYHTCVNANHANVADVAHFAENAGTANLAHNAENLNDISSTQFLRSDTSGTLIGNLTINGNLEVNGSFIQFPTTSFACDATTAGAVYFDTTSNELLLCNGTNFVAFN